MNKIKYVALIVFLFFEVMPKAVQSQTAELEIKKNPGKSGIEFSYPSSSKKGEIILRFSEPKSVQDSFCCKFCVKCDCDDCPHFADFFQGSRTISFVPIDSPTMSTNLPEGFYTVLVKSEKDVINLNYKLQVVKSDAILLDQNGNQVKTQKALMMMGAMDKW